MEAPLLVAALLVAVVGGPWLARIAARLAARDETARADRRHTVVVTVAFAVLLAGAVLVTALRPATVALAWAAGAAVVLASVDLTSHRLPDRVTYPAGAVCTAALLVDAAVLGSWGAFLRALAAAAVAFAVAYLVAAIAPAASARGRTARRARCAHHATAGAPGRTGR